MNAGNNPLVSVVMPVYNARSYVEKAIESVLQQSYTQLELILVDDGATDGSGEVCDKYAEQDSRIVVIHQKNGGISNARNRAIQIARGKYVAFCDHDDEMLPHCLENAVYSMESRHAQMVKFPYQHDLYSYGKLIRTGSQALPEESFQIDQLIDRYELFFAAVRVLWNGLYVTGLIRENQLRFDETVRFGMEDFLFNLRYLGYVQSVAFLPKKGYVHYDRYEQSTDERYDENKLYARVKAAVAEKEFLQGRTLRKSTWVRHQITYLSMYLITLNHPDCQLAFLEKKRRLKELNTPEKLALHCGKVYCLTLFREPKSLLISLLFNFRLYTLLLWIYLTFSQRHKRLAGK